MKYFLMRLLAAGHKSSKQQKTGHPLVAGSSCAEEQYMMPVHKGVQCDKCGVCPIQGPLYNSQVIIKPHVSACRSGCAQTLVSHFAKAIRTGPLGSSMALILLAIGHVHQ